MKQGLGHFFIISSSSYFFNETDFEQYHLLNAFVKKKRFVLLSKRSLRCEGAQLLSNYTEPHFGQNCTYRPFWHYTLAIFAVDTPDLAVEVTCPKVKEKHLRSFKTRNIDDNLTTGKINETFKFVIPSDLDENEEFPIIVSNVQLGILSKLLLFETKSSISRSCCIQNWGIFPASDLL